MNSYACQLNEIQVELSMLKKQRDQMDSMIRDLRLSCKKTLCGCRQCKAIGNLRQDVRRCERSAPSTKRRTDVSVQVIHACLEEEDLWTDTSEWALFSDCQDEDDSRQDFQGTNPSTVDISKDLYNNSKSTLSAPVALSSGDSIQDSVVDLPSSSVASFPPKIRNEPDFKDWIMFGNTHLQQLPRPST